MLILGVPNSKINWELCNFIKDYISNSSLAPWSEDQPSFAIGDVPLQPLLFSPVKTTEPTVPINLVNAILSFQWVGRGSVTRSEAERGGRVGARGRERLRNFDRGGRERKLTPCDHLLFW